MVGAGEMLAKPEYRTKARRFAHFVVAIAAALLPAACAAPVGEDWLWHDARSPDGRWVARLWCEELCDVPGRATLTVSLASRPLAITPSDVAGFPPTGTAPLHDAVVAFYRPAREGAPPNRLAWTGPTALTVHAPCARDGNDRPLPPRYRAGPVAVTLAAAGPC